MAALNRESLLSSPDLLAKSVNDRTSSPVRDLKRITAVTPTKTAVEGKNNIKLQDFYLTTPPAGLARLQSPTRSVKQTESHISPWRIRVRVEAEREGHQGSVGAAVRGISGSPSKRAGFTKTITVPLKDADDSPQQPKRTRGRPRKSTGTPAKRPGTPKPVKSRRRPSQSEGSEAETNTGQSPKRKGPGRPRKSSISQLHSTEERDMDAEQDDVSTLFQGLTKPLGIGVHKRKNMGGRRKTLGPIDIAIDSDASINDEPALISVDALSEDTGFSSRQKRTELSEQHFAVHDVLPDGSPSHSPLQTRSSISPQKGKSRIQLDKIRTKEHDVTDPTEEHDEYDSIMESEGFTMVSLASLPSAQQHLNLSSLSSRVPNVQTINVNNNNNNSDTHLSISAKDISPVDGKAKQRTPSQFHSSPRLPPPVKPASVSASPRAVDKASGGTPELVRVVKAGIALQGILEPVASAELVNSGESNGGQPSASAKSPRDRMDDLFSGFGVGTRRELRAGLRFGEELAKRQRLASKTASPVQADDDDVFQALAAQSTRKIPTPTPDDSYKLSIPRDPDPVIYPPLPKEQLPSPENSLGENDEDAMDWKMDPPGQVDQDFVMGGVQPTPAQAKLFSPGEPIMNRTLLEREAEWQREREAISKEIDRASASQVFVVDSDDATPDIVHMEREALGVANDDVTTDIWQVEAHSSSQLDSNLSVSGPKALFAEGPIKPRRSKLPTPWRKTQVVYSDEVEPQDDASDYRATKHGRSPGSPVIQKRAKYLASDESVLSEFADGDGEAPYNSKIQGSPVRRPAQGVPNSVEQRVRKQLLGDRWKVPGRHDEASLPSDNATHQRNLQESTESTLEEKTEKERVHGDEDKLQPVSEESMHDDEETITQHSTIGFGEPRDNLRLPLAKAQAPRPDLSSIGTSTIISQTSSYLADYSPTAAGKSWLARISSAIPSTFQTWLLALKSQEDNQAQLSSHSDSAVSNPRPVSLPSNLKASSKRSTSTTRPTPPTNPQPARLPLSKSLPWTRSHYRRLRSLYLSALAHPSSYPLRPASASHRMLNLEVESLGWRKRLTALELGVVDAFMRVLHEEDEDEQRKGGGNVSGKLARVPILIDEAEVAKRVFSLWAGRVQRGETELRDGTAGAWDARFEWRREAVLASQRTWTIEEKRRT